jgi:hypothetical protein
MHVDESGVCCDDEMDARDITLVPACYDFEKGNYTTAKLDGLLVAVCACIVELTIASSLPSVQNKRSDTRDMKAGGCSIPYHGGSNADCTKIRTTTNSAPLAL